MLQHGWTIKTLCYLKEVSLNRPYIAWFYLYEMSRIGRSMATKWIDGFLGLGVSEREEVIL